MIAESERLEKAIATVLDSGVRTGDIMSEGCTQITTSDMGKAIREAYSAA